MSVNPYDHVPYQSYAYVASHPGRLALIAKLFGLSPADPQQCRVLEIGCASGGNLLPMAAAFPDSRFVGLDYSAVQIAEANAAREALALGNIAFLCEDIRQAEAAALGQFDYVIAHGIYSWLPPDAQEAMLNLYRDCLAPGGIAYISYNTLPGWRMRGIVRDMMLFHAELFGDDTKKVEQAKALLDFMAASIPSENNPYGMYLSHELQLLSSVNDSYLRHDHLEEHNEPLYFREFMRRANDKGMCYLGESDFSTMVGTGITESAYRQMSAEIKDIIRLEQYMDFLRNRTFRQTLLVKDDVEIKRKIVGANLESLFVSALLTPELADTGTPDTQAVANAPFDDQTVIGFKSAGGQGLQTGSAITKAALACLAEVHPRALALTELVHTARQRLSAARRSMVSERQDRERLSNDLLVAYTMPGLIQLHAWPAPIAGVVAAKPATTPYIRWQAGRGAELTSLLHETVRVDEPSRLILQELDGTRSKAELVQVLHGMMIDGRVKVEADGCSLMMAADDPRLAELLDQVLAQLARLALLTTSAG